MSIKLAADSSIPADMEAYETVAGQEEIYLEEVEEEVRAMLIADEPPVSQAPLDPLQVIEELITGDGDDPPLSDDALGQMLPSP
jgi:hypothetical protein